MNSARGQDLAELEQRTRLYEGLSSRHGRSELRVAHPRTGGLGLGLALVKGLAELHGGRVSVHSEGVGKGATFVVRLPLDRRRTPRLRAVAPPETIAQRRVLIVEDNVDSALTLQEALTMDGHVVEVAYSGPEGLEKAGTFLPEVILCDLGLPGMDGYAIARQVRAHQELGSVGLIALSGYAQPEDVEKAQRAGFDLHIAKPADLEALRRTLVEVGLREAEAGRTSAKRACEGRRNEGRPSDSDA